MFDSIDYDGLKARLDSAMEHEKQRLDEARRKHNVAAFVDFASNLLALAGYGKGARLSLATDAQSRCGDYYAQAKERYSNALRDYEGRIADMDLRRRMRANTVPVASLKDVPSLKTSAVGENISLRSGLFERNMKEFDKKQNLSKYNKQLKKYDYVNRKQ